MASDSKKDDAISFLEAAVDACHKHQYARSDELFEKFYSALSAYKLDNNLPMPRDTTSFEENTQCERFAVDSIPLNLYSLANCLSQRNHIPKADGAISRIVALVASDQRLAYLRQNIYQEAARFYSQMGKFELADEYLSRQLAIVKQKGSEVLTDFVKINLLINQGNWAASRHDLITAELKYSQALLLVESQWEPSKEQIELLFAGIARL